jgi:DNA-binding winged helix-turn-helix (wHTH) protein
LYGWGEDIESNALEVHIHHLRKKFYPELIKTVRGVGYIIEKLRHEIHSSVFATGHVFGTLLLAFIVSF